jgi:hypothetical protein
MLWTLMVVESILAMVDKYGKTVKEKWRRRSIQQVLVQLCGGTGLSVCRLGQPGAKGHSRFCPVFVVATCGVARGVA